MNGFLLTGGFVGNLPSRRLNSQFIHLDFYSFEFPNSINENDTFKRSAVLIRSIADVRKRIMVGLKDNGCCSVSFIYDLADANYLHCHGL